MIKTKDVTDRRTLHFDSIAELVADIDALGLDDDAMRASGNWTPAQIVTHVTFLIECSLDGFPMKAPLALRVLGRFMRGGVKDRTIKPGLPLPGALARAMPPSDARWSDAVEALHAVATRIERGDTMTQPSPIFGALTHEEWVGLHCRHAEMHFSFLHPVTGAAAADGAGSE